MPTPKKGKGGGKKKRPPSRERIAYTIIPKEYAAMLRTLTAEGAKHEGRSVSYLTKVAVREFLVREGLLDARGRPAGGGADPGGAA